jgi:NADH:ubiquinone oxidoreductase subunit 3 (subunit A)
MAAAADSSGEATFRRTHTELALLGPALPVAAAAPVAETSWDSWCACWRPARPSARRQFYTIAVTYVLFTLVDGALRLLVLLQANQVGFSAFQVSLMFVLYELLGVFTNLGAGVLGARFGLKNTLLLGLGLEIVSVRVPQCAPPVRRPPP